MSANEIDKLLNEANLMSKESGKPFIMEHARRMRNQGRHKDAVLLMRGYANNLIEKGDFGWATDLIMEAADWCREIGDYKFAALMLSNLATVFLDSEKRLYGWAASNYYAAAMCYIEQGDVTSARDVLRAAYDGYFSKVNDFHTPWFREHLSILDNKNLGNIEKLEALVSDFRLKNRDSWVRSCHKGIEALLGVNDFNKGTG